MNPFEQNLGGGGQLSEASFSNLGSAGKWARFLAILGFVSCGLMVLLGLIVMLAGAAIESRSYRGMDFPIWLLGLVYMVMAVVYFFPAKKLNDFAGRAIAALAQRDPRVVEETLMELHSFFKLIGIYTIVGMVLSFLYFFVILLAMMAGAARF